MHCCEKRLVYITKNSCLYLVQHSKKSFCPENIRIISLIITNMVLGYYHNIMREMIKEFLPGRFPQTRLLLLATI